MTGTWVMACSLVVGPMQAHAALHTQTVEYRDGETVLEGYLAYDDISDAKRPGILVVHEWMGLGPYVKHRAEQLAELGYVAFAADIYGKGVRVKDQKEAAELAGYYRGDRPLLRARVEAGLDVLKRHPLVDTKRLAAIGYCFGGTAALELARAGAPLQGVVSFHGGLDTPTPQDAVHIKARILVLRGADDPFVPPDQVAAFEKEMQDAIVDYRIVTYPGAVHSFTLPDAGNDPSKGAAYNPEADRQSWAEMKQFFATIFQ